MTDPLPGVEEWTAALETDPRRSGVDRPLSALRRRGSVSRPGL